MKSTKGLMLWKDDFKNEKDWLATCKALEVPEDTVEVELAATVCVHQNFYRKTKRKPNLQFTHLKRMCYAESVIPLHKKKNEFFDDRITVCLYGTGKKEYVSELQVVWLKFDNTPYDDEFLPHIEVFADGLEVAYCDEFKKALDMVKANKNFTPEDFSRALVSCGFVDKSDLKLGGITK